MAENDVSVYFDAGGAVEASKHHALDSWRSNPRLPGVGAAGLLADAEARWAR